MNNFIVYAWTETSCQHKDGRFDPWTFTHISQISKIRDYAEKQGISPLRSVWLWQRPNLQAPKIGHFHIDLDSSLDVDKARLTMNELIKGLEKHYGIDPYTLRIGFSGKKG